MAESQDATMSARFVCPRGHRHHEGSAFCTVCGAGPVLKDAQSQDAFEREQALRDATSRVEAKTSIDFVEEVRGTTRGRGPVPDTSTDALRSDARWEFKRVRRWRWYPIHWPYGAKIARVPYV